MKLERGSGILCHITSLPSAYGIGDLGPEAFRFVDLLAQARQKYWQILPLNPTDAIFYESPYSSLSAFAVNPLFISPERLADDGLLTKDDIAAPPFEQNGSVDYEAVKKYKMDALAIAFKRWTSTSDKDFDDFEKEHSFWLDDYALFSVLKDQFDGASWVDWPVELRDRHTSALAQKRKELAEKILFVKFHQYLVHKQWKALKAHCAARNVKIIGDLPIYVEHGGVDVWCSPELFKLNEVKRPYVVAGVPPDYFSKTGQRWGNPIYNWEKMQQNKFAWWSNRLAQNLKLFDIVRIDHFRGLVAYWEVPAEEKTAVKGEWVKVPTDDFIAALQKACPNFNVIAEDLGLVTQDVIDTLERNELPGMKVLQFAFGDSLETNAFLPHNYEENCITYTGTHDNNTTLGWYHEEATDKDRWNLGAYFSKEITEDNVVDNLIELALSSRANVAIVPVQDILGLDETHRMNTPGTTEKNWMWRLAKNQLAPENLQWLAELTQRNERA